jgi:hypothetical protein
VTWMLYSRSEEVRSAITPHRNINGLNAIHFSPDRRDFQLKPTGVLQELFPLHILSGGQGRHVKVCDWPAWANQRSRPNRRK